jgi:type IV pilus assembly protein PilN
MTRINLLPWREELRKERQKRFAAISVVAIVAMLAVIGVVHLNYAAAIHFQNQRNNLLKTEIKKLDKKIAEIKALEKEKANLIARMNVIQQLQGRRPQVVHVFDEIVTTLPEGVYLTKVTNRGRRITMEGFAQSNARVSSYMRNIEKAEWLKYPKLTIIETKAAKGRRNRISKFILHATQVTPKKKDASADDKQAVKKVSKK